MTAVAVAASTAVALAPAANAFYGDETVVKGAVLSTAKMAAATGWNTTDFPLTGTVRKAGTKDWTNEINQTTITASQVVPSSTELIVSTSVAGRDALYASVQRAISGYATSVAANTATVYTIDTFTAGNGGFADVYEGVSLRKAGSDGIAITSCAALGNTTTTPAQRTNCASALSTAQAASWATISPNLVWKSTAAVKGKLLAGPAARKAAKAAKGTKVKVVSTRSGTGWMSGREIERVYRFTSAKSKVSGAAVSVTQHGNRTNATISYGIQKQSDQQDFRKLYSVGSDRYTASSSVKVNGKSVRVAATTIRYSGIVITASCLGSVSKKPSAASLRTCSKGLAAAELKKAKPLFSAIR